MPHRRDAPKDHRDRKAFASTEPVHQAANNEQANSISCLERRLNKPVFGSVPPDCRPKCLVSRDDPENLTVDVVYCRCKKQEGTDQPPATPDMCRDLVKSRHGRTDDCGTSFLRRGNLAFGFGLVDLFNDLVDIAHYASASYMTKIPGDRYSRPFNTVLI